MITVGVDPSINSTGVCINIDGTYIYYNIVSNPTKKLLNIDCNCLYIKPYLKADTKDLEYNYKEMSKTNNIYNICKILGEILGDLGDINKIYMEGISYGSTRASSLVDLAGLNFALRLLFKNLGIQYEIIAPTALKKNAVGIAGADKNTMIDAWKRLDPRISDLGIRKMDDLADAFFLACYNEA